MLIRKKFLILYSAAAAIIGFGGCASGENDGPIGSGRVDLTLEADISIEQSVESRATTPYMPVLSSLTADKLNITLTNKSGSYSSTWPSRAEFPSEKEFPADTYTMTATFGNTAAEGFESPQLYGESTFQVVGGKVSPVKITAKVANSLVMLEPTEKFVNYFQSVKLVLNSAAGNSLVVNPGETRPVYVNPGTARIDARVVMPSGKDALITIGSFTAKKGVLHRITLDVEATTGTALLTVTFDDTLADAKPIEIQLSEALFTEPAPVVTPEGFTGGQPIDLLETYVDEDYAFNIATRAGLVSAKLSIIDGTSSPDVYDLLNHRDLEVIEKMGLQLINVEEGAQFSKVKLKDLLAKIRCNDRENVSAKKITLSVMDRLGRTTEEQLADNNTLAVNLTPIKISVKAVNDVVVNPTFQIVTNYNGRDIDKVKFYVKNKNGQRGIVIPTEVVPGSAEGEYLVTLNTPRNMSYFILSGDVDDEIYSKEEIFVPDFEPSVADRYKWATHATLTIMPDSAAKYGTIIGQNITLSGVDASQIHRHEDNPLVFDITGLEPGKQHTIKSSLTTLTTKSSTFTTEQALQLPNGDMEDWHREDGGTEYWWKEYPGTSVSAVWGTMNLLTTSEGGTHTSWTNRNGCAYSAISGTIGTNDSHTGKAALIRTVGWGGGNSASANAFSGGFGKCEHVTAGELYLGSYNVNNKSADYNGITFISRPSSIEFWYKYKTVTANDDFAEVEIVLYENTETDADKAPVYEEFIRSYKKLERADSYTRMTVDIDYPKDCPKAAKIMVRFKSSGNPSSCVANSTYMTPPPALDTSDGQYMGSQLYIDDIKLNY